MDKFTQQIETARKRTEILNEYFMEIPGEQQGLLTQVFEEMNVALEELQVAEEELRQQNEQLASAYSLVEEERQRYQELFDYAPDCYLVTDVDGKILEANRTAANLFQIQQKYLKGKLLINFVPEQHRRSFRTQLLQLREIETLQEWEIQLETRRGDCFDAAISVTTVNDATPSPKWRWLVRDITARKQAEVQLQSIQSENLQLQEASLLKSQFLAMVSHELRTPMHAILGFAQLLLRQPYQQSSHLQNMVERILSNARHLLALIEDILDYSALEAGRLNLNLRPFDLVERVTATIEELRPLAQQKHLFLNIKTELHNQIVINDCDRVRQIVVNLLSNAIKFTDRGSILLEIQETPGNRILIVVTDTGIGIAPKDLKNIFQEFRQVNQSFTRKQGGTGLGLSIVDKLVRLMQGTITVESKLGEGSTFRVELPREIGGKR
jgi:PAS domain S-box-containing protein